MGKFTTYDMNESGNYTNATLETWPSQDALSFGGKVVYTMLVCPMMVICVTGNALTIIAYATDPKLQTVQNVYLLNLAVADFCVGCVSMPFYFVTTMLDYHWIFGRLFCKVWNSVDFFVCLAGAYAVVLISIDRSLMVWQGAAYSVRQTKKQAAVRILISWSVSFLVYVPAVFMWDVWVGESVVPEGVCDVEFVDNLPYTLTTAILEFVFPFLSITILSFYLYVSITRKSRLAVNTHAWSNCSARSQASFHTICKELDNNPNTMSSNVSGAHTNTSGVKEKLTGNKNRKSGDAEKRILRRNQKAARRLAVLLGVFIVCWTPYTVATIFIAACYSCVSDHLYEALIWLQWANSVINPFLYAYTTPRFRQNYVQLLHLDRVTNWRKTSSQIATPAADTSVFS